MARIERIQRMAFCAISMHRVSLVLEAFCNVGAGACGA